MAENIAKNMSTVVVGLAVFAVVTAAVAAIVRDKKNPGNSCGIGCSGCPNSGVCHKKEKASS